MLLQFMRREKTSVASEEEGFRTLEAATDRLDLSGNPVRSMRLGIAFLVLGLGGFVLWAAFAPLDEGVPAQGAIVVESQRKPVQHLGGGIVRRVFVSEAQRVQAGEVLIELDDSRLRAEFEAVKAQHHGALALKARLEAEREGANKIAFPPELKEAAAQDDSARQKMLMQEQLFVSRHEALQAELRAIDNGVAALVSQRTGLEARLAGRRAQYRLIEEQLAGSRGLAAEGYLPRNRLLEEERLAADVFSQIADLEAGIAANRSSVAEATSRREARANDFRQRVDAELTDVSRDAPAYKERLGAVQSDLLRTRLVAPVTGSVVGLQVQSVGAVIPPGGKAMDIVPADEKMMLEVRIPPHLIDSVHPGLIADVRFHAFQDAPQLVTEGRLTSVSADRLTDPTTHEPYFLGRIEVLPETMKHLEGKTLVPGMSAEAVIKTGERSLLDYLVRPLIRRVSTAMTEY